MRSTRWTSAIRSVTRYEVRDAAGQVLAAAGSHAEGARMLLAFAMTSPGREEDVRLISLDADGTKVLTEDVFDLEVASIDGN